MSRLRSVRRSVAVLSVLWLSTTALAEAEAPRGGDREGAIPVVIDTDMDSDDAMAILYLLASNKVEVLGLSVSGNGFMLPIDGVPIALRLIVLGGHPHLPVAYGRFQGLLDVGGFPQSWRQGAMTFYKNAGLPDAARPPYPKSAADLIVDLVRASERRVAILGLGPNTNIALALAQDPSIIARIDQVVLSAGAFEVAGNVADGAPAETFLENTASYRSLVAAASRESVAEYNVFLDVPATSAIIESGAKVLFSPLDASQMAPVNEELVSELKARPQNAVTRFVLGDLEPLITQKIPTYLWDPVAAALIIDPSICTDLRASKTHVVVDSSASFGKTETGGFGRETRICFAIDAERFYDDFLATLSPTP